MQESADIVAALDRSRGTAFTVEESDAIRDWMVEGEQLNEQSVRVSVLFFLGAWWADRPWRRRK